MIFDHRTYTCRPGTIKKHMALYEKEGWATQSRHLGQPLMYATTETGNVNSYVHIWVYQDAADRAARRAALGADPEWSSFLKASSDAGYLISQENKILTPVSFFDTKY
jgi:hypothetical protein